MESESPSTDFGSDIQLRKNTTPFRLECVMGQVDLEGSGVPALDFASELCNATWVRMEWNDAEMMRSIQGHGEREGTR